MTEEGQQLIKSSVEAAFKPFVNLIERVFGGSCDEIGGMLQDGLKVRRATRQLKLFAKLQAAIEKAGFDPKPIPDSIWIPLLQEASLHDDDDLQTRWGNLLANAADPRQERPVLPGFSDILRELAPQDAKFLDALYAETTKRGSLEFSEGDLMNVLVQAGLSRMKNHDVVMVQEYEDNKEDYKADAQSLGLTLDLALRHKVLTEKSTRQEINVDQLSKILGSAVQYGVISPMYLEPSSVYTFTHLGVAFMRACQQPT